MMPDRQAIRELLAERWPVLAIGVALLAGVILCYQYMQGEASEYQTAADQAQRCQELARQITSARGESPLPSGALAGTPESADSTASIQESADEAQIPTDSIDRIEHDPGSSANLAGNTPGQQTEIALHGITLRQLVDFVAAMEHASIPMVSQTMAVVAPNQSEDDRRANPGEDWDITLRVWSARSVKPSAVGGIQRGESIR